MKKNQFRIGLCDSGAFCYVTNVAQGTTAYLRKDGTLHDFYDGNFFPSLVEAAEFLEDYLENLPVEITRDQVAEAFKISKNFIIVN